MAQITVPGKMQEYISNIDFSLNFEDQKKSTRVRIGDFVKFDGVTASHKDKLTGLEMAGKATPLKSAIANNWLTLNVKGAKIAGPINTKVEHYRDSIPVKDGTFDDLTGGDFEAFAKKEGIVSSTHQVIKEEDQVVKKTLFNGEKETKVAPKAGKMEVFGDQVNVKTISQVTSSTSSISNGKRAKMEVIRTDDGQSSRMIETPNMKSQAKGSKKAQNSFTVDGSSRSLPDDFTLAEIRRATETVQMDASQDAKVVKKIGEVGKMPLEPNEQEGIVLRKTSFANKEASAGGSTPVADLSGVSTQAEVNQIEAAITKKEQAKPDYLSMLPKDWATLHWTKKEKFIMEIKEVGFLKYVMNVETTKAVIAAVRKRMLELEKLILNA